MDLQPTLEGPRLRLRPLREADLEPLYAAASDPLIWEVHPERERWKRPVFEAFFAKGLASGGAFAVVDKADGKIVGTSRYYDFDAAARRVAIGYTFLTRKHWGGSYNKELKTLMLEHAFKSVDAVIFHVGEHNVRSRRAMEKIGGTLTGRLERTRPDGRPDPTVVYEIRRACKEGG